MKSFETAIIIILFVVLAVSILAGIVNGNRQLEQSQNWSRLSIVYNLWLIIKFLFIGVLLSALISGAIRSFIKDDITKLIIDVLIIGLASFIGYEISRKKVFAKMRDIDDINLIAKNMTHNGGTSAETFVKDESGNSEYELCPFAGRIITQTETTVLGFRYPTNKEIFTIKSDWSVSTPNNLSFGWIDAYGEIHDGFPDRINGKINYKATLHGKVIAKLKFEFLFVDGEKLGSFVK